MTGAAQSFLLAGRDALLAELRVLVDDERPAVVVAEAAELWARYHRRGDLRCRWARGESLRLAGESSAAVAVLEEVEADAVLLDQGITNGLIAVRLGIARRTVVTLIESASATLGAGSRSPAVALAHRDPILSVG